jgi:hypothetical protein
VPDLVECILRRYPVDGRQPRRDRGPGLPRLLPCHGAQCAPAARCAKRRRRFGVRKAPLRNVFINRAADFGRYDAVIIDSVSFWQIGDNNVSPEDQQTLTDQLYLSLDTKLNEKGFATVREPGPNTLLLRAAITQAVGAKTVSNAVTSIMPQTRLLASLSGMAADTAVLVGQAAIEVDIRDSVSEERVAAAVDRRVGTKAIRAAFSEWKHVTEAFDYWAERIALRLVELREGKS